MRGTKAIIKYVQGSWEPGVDKIMISHMDSLSNTSHGKDRMKKIMGWLATALCIMSQSMQEDSVTPDRALSLVESITDFEENLSVRGQQTTSASNCGWWVALNARWYLLKECGQNVAIPTEVDIQKEQDLYKRMIRIMPSANKLELQPPASSPFQYNIPDLFRCTRKYLDEALLLVVEYVTTGGTRSEAEERSKKRKQHASNRGVKVQIL